MKSMWKNYDKIAGEKYVKFSWQNYEQNQGRREVNFRDQRKHKPKIDPHTNKTSYVKELRKAK